MSTKAISAFVRNAPTGRFANVQRPYTLEQVVRLRGSMKVTYTLAEETSNKLWKFINEKPYVAALGCLTGNQAVQCVRAGLDAIYLSGWQVAADANQTGDMYPDQSLYPSNSGPELARRINNALRRADEIEVAETGSASCDWFKPVVADCEAGFGGALNCFELTKAYIEAGVAGVHFEDQLGAEKKCGHMGGKVLIPTAQHIRHLNAARLAADVCEVPTVIIARTDSEAARLLTNDIDERDHPFIDWDAGRTGEGFFRLKNDGLNHSIARAIEFAPYSDLVWMETSDPDLGVAKRFAEAFRKVHPEKRMAYNCSPSFNWGAKMSPEQAAQFQRELGAMGYAFQFVTLAGFHINNYGMFNLAREYATDGMAAYNQLQQQEFAAEKHGYTAVKHQREVGASYFDAVATTAAGGQTSTTALHGSTEEGQFYKTSKRSFSTAASAFPPNIEFTKPIDHDILTTEAQLFLAKLHGFNKRRLALLERRKVIQDEISCGKRTVDFLSETEEIRKSNWTVNAPPADMLDRRVEITGPVDRKMVINALNSGANVFMADFEDSNTPTWINQLDGQRNLRDAVRGTISLQTSQKSYKLNDNHAVLNVRPRGWHLPEKHMKINGEYMSGSLFDFGLFLFHNAETLRSKKTGPYFYLPKLQSHEEAALWNDVFDYSEDLLELPRGTIKCTVLIEHIQAAFQMHEILHALRKHIIGLNCGRWDYIFSFIKTFSHSRTHILPDRFQVGMTTPFMRAYSLLTINTCHQRGAHAMGGMAAQIPIKSNKEANEKALSAVRQDKLREANDGHDGTWVAHPGLVPLAKEMFDEQMKEKNQIGKINKNVHVGTEDLLALPSGTCTEQHGLRHNVNVTLGYLASWLNGTGCVPLYNMMEDAATAEISRSQLWQWRKHEIQLDSGINVDEQSVVHAIEEERKYWHMQGQFDPKCIDEAAALLQRFILRERLDEFLTLEAYDMLVEAGH